MRAAGQRRRRVFTAIRDMWVRGAPLIGATAAYGLALQMRRDAGDAALRGRPPPWLASARPTAVNLAWALERMLARAAAAAGGRSARAAAWARGRRHRRGRRRRSTPPSAATAWRCCRPSPRASRGPVAERADALQRRLAGHRGLGHRPAPIYLAHAAGMRLHVWVDETRPRNQGASLTAWELGQAGVPHTRGGRQRRRPPDAARPGRHRASSAATASPRAATSATRSAPT